MSNTEDKHGTSKVLQSWYITRTYSLSHLKDENVKYIDIFSDTAVSAKFTAEVVLKNYVSANL